MLNGKGDIKLASDYEPKADVMLFQGDCLKLLAKIPSESVDLVVTSPPYNLGKPYEDRLDLDTYLDQQAAVITQCIRVLRRTGSICWQVGNYVDKGSIIPLDAIIYPIFAKAGLRMRNRIVWHFEHGLHCNRRFSGRYEVIAWYTKSDHYKFALDPVRVPQKYPGKRYFKGPKVGKLSCNPKGKNPSDVWTIPNVKHNHVEKTSHPCQFPVELIERLVLTMTSETDTLLDPFMGVGSALIAAVRHHRRAIGAEIQEEYWKLAIKRIELELSGTLRTRPMNRPVYEPSGREKVCQRLFDGEDSVENSSQAFPFERT